MADASGTHAVDFFDVLAAELTETLAPDFTDARAGLANRLAFVDVMRARLPAHLDAPARRLAAAGGSVLAMMREGQQVAATALAQESARMWRDTRRSPSTRAEPIPRYRQGRQSFTGFTEEVLVCCPRCQALRAAPWRRPGTSRRLVRTATACLPCVRLREGVG